MSNNSIPVSKQLVDLARSSFDFGIDAGNKPYGVRKGGHIAQPLKGSSSSVRQHLGGEYYEQLGKVASDKALTEAVQVLTFEARKAEPRRTHLRTARHGNEIYVDLGDVRERVLKVTADGWEVLDASSDIPVRFRRTNLTMALPVPQEGGDISRLWDFVNVTDQGDRELIIGWLVSTYVLVDLPVPLIALLGEQGTAKTSSLRRLLSLFDPTSAPVRRPPSDAEKLLHAGAHSRSVGFDNLSVIPQWLSDGMCRMVTGEGDVDRALYTDDEARIISVQGVLGFTGIDVGNMNGDLAERTVWGNLQVIPPERRRSERELNEEWAEAYPSILGGLLDLVVLALQTMEKS